ncbi:M10 family metallopeptidase [Tsuneonella dongtanensis]|uniref:M10 family metallopeptidase n=1 Tax=Tsuneonella dongtanensis TaxID=692370 RepID=UPI0008295228|nr:M10 family metallopeptidase [Tsuneonella dongtanensis]
MLKNTTIDSIGGPAELRNPDPDGDGIAFNGKPVYSTEEAAAQLNRDGAIWPVKNGTITYSFAEHAPGGQYNNPKLYDALGSYIEGFVPFTSEQRDATREAIALWDDLIAVKFVEKNGYGADIVYMNTSTGPAQASAFTPFYQGGHGRFAKIQGDTYINSDQPDNFDLDYSGYGFSTLVHETGHAIGLEHPGDYNFGSGLPISYAKDAEYFQDSYQFTIMSYFNAGNTGSKGYVNWATGGFFQTPQTPMLHDIAAVQAMYGADTTTRTGDTTYGFNSTADRDVFDFSTNINPFLTIYDAGGHDTLDLSGWTRNSVLDLREGEFSSGFGQVVNAAELNALYGLNLTQAFWDALFEGRTSNPGFLSDNIGIAIGTVIEDGITGSGNDRLIGNAVGNVLNGGKGNDIYTGNAGADTFVIGEAGFLDTITDFKSGEDKLDLSALSTDASHVQAVGLDLLIDLDGNGVADLIIRSQGDAIQTSDILFG